MSGKADERSASQRWPTSEEAIRHRIAQSWGIAFTDNILPLLSAFDERERVAIVTREAEIFLKTYCRYLEDIAKRSQELVNDAIACSLKTIVFVKEPK